MLYRSTELDFNWSWFQLRCMQVGGNASAVSTWRQNISTQSTDFNPSIACHSPIATQFLLYAFLCLFPAFLWQVAFFSQHGSTASAANAKYNSRAAQLYREKIKTLATQATRRHGTEVMQMRFFTVLKRPPACAKHTSASCVPLSLPHFV